MHIPPLDRASYPVVTMSNGASVRPSRSQTASPEFVNIQKIVRSALGSLRVSVAQIERLSARLHRVYLLRLHDGRQLVLKLPPLGATRLLSHEKYSLQQESQILDLLAAGLRTPAPRIVQCDPTAHSFGSPYLLRTYATGTSLSSLSTHLSTREWVHFDRSIGRCLREVTSITAGQFGPAIKVQQRCGSSSWREAFLSLLETSLRDAEDYLISLPYDNIRNHGLRHGHLLNPVTVPQLVPMEAGLPHNVLVDEHSRQVTGLLGLGDVVFGDPLLGTVFANASEAFWDGYGMCPSRAGAERIRQLL